MFPLQLVCLVCRLAVLFPHLCSTPQVGMTRVPMFPTPLFVSEELVFFLRCLTVANGTCSLPFSFSFLCSSDALPGRMPLVGTPSASSDLMFRIFFFSSSSFFAPSWSVAPMVRATPSNPEVWLAVWLLPHVTDGTGSRLAWQTTRLRARD